MKRLRNWRKQSVLLIALLSLLSFFVLSACAGTAVIDVNVDPDTGTGNIVVTGNEGDSGQADVDGDGDSDMSQVLLFGLVIALLLGTVAIVMSVARRPR